MVQITCFVHGTTSDNETGRATGWNPGQLSELGTTQSRQLPDMLDAIDFDVMISSDLKRAVESTKLGFEGKVPLKQDQRLRGCNYGDFNGAKEYFKDDIEQYIDLPFPNGESYRDVEARIRSLLDDVVKEYAGGHVAFMAHQAPQLALEVLLNGKSWEEAFGTVGVRQKHGNRVGSTLFLMIGTTDD